MGAAELRRAAASSASKIDGRGEERRDPGAREVRRHGSCVEQGPRRGLPRLLSRAGPCGDVPNWAAGLLQLRGASGARAEILCATIGMVDPDTREELLATLQMEVRSGFGSDDDVLAGIPGLVEEIAGAADPDLARELAGLARGWLDEQRRRELTWKSATTNDAIDRAFEELDAQGVVALQNAGMTASEGWSDVGEIAAQRDDLRGATFYHGQDLARGVEGEGLWLTFGALVDGPEHDTASVAVGFEICAALHRHGVETTWNGSVDRRISIPPFEWRKRRSTKAPG